MAYGSKMHIPPTNDNLLAAHQPITEKYWRIFRERETETETETEQQQ